MLLQVGQRDHRIEQVGEARLPAFELVPPPFDRLEGAQHLPHVEQLARREPRADLTALERGGGVFHRADRRRGVAVGQRVRVDRVLHELAHVPQVARGLDGQRHRLRVLAGAELRQPREDLIQFNCLTVFIH